MKFEMFSEVQLKNDIPQYNLHQGMTAIIVDYCPRPDGEEKGYVLEVLDEQEQVSQVVALAESQLENV